MARRRRNSRRRRRRSRRTRWTRRSWRPTTTGRNAILATSGRTSARTRRKLHQPEIVGEANTIQRRSPTVEKLEIEDAVLPRDGRLQVRRDVTASSGRDIRDFVDAIIVTDADAWTILVCYVIWVLCQAWSSKLRAGLQTRMDGKHGDWYTWRWSRQRQREN